MKTIPLTKGYFTKVDDEDYEKFAIFRWRADTSKKSVRAVRHIYQQGKQVCLSLPRLILNAPPKKYVDHINGDTLDNRKSNLRLCTFEQNTYNRKKEIRNTSGYKGVMFDKNNNKWLALVTVKTKPVRVGLFSKKEEAAYAYETAAKMTFGKFHRNTVEKPLEISKKRMKEIREFVKTKFALRMMVQKNYQQSL